MSNPGALRITMDEALEGGISDPRNASVFKMFVLVNVGERIGSGLQNLRYVWEQMGLEVPVLRESFFLIGCSWMLFYGMGIMQVGKEWITWSLPPPVESDLTELEERFFDFLVIRSHFIPHSNGRTLGNGA
ncbi:ATP-binding protein [uncultured Parabacteroides sp.]|uniref:ATP-binding protein n=1 Tax=uncultured Parabacteroides sp. TaxID=512312 RepID=UPI002729EE6C|nr:ATP-binding protein [uncultured Parabacteroides sp.]